FADNTWEYDGVAWTLRDTVGAQLLQPSMAFDVVRGQCVLHDPSPPLGQTFTWDGTSWQLVSSAQPGPGSPLVYDTKRSQVTGLFAATLFAWTTQPATVRSYGNGCAGSGGPLRLDVSQRAVLGSDDCRLEVTEAMPGAFCGLFA